MDGSAPISADLAANFIDFSLAGEGAEAKVWKAREIGSGRWVAIKQLGSSESARIHSVFSLLRTLESPHLPAVLELRQAGPSGADSVTSDGVAGEQGQKSSKTSGLWLVSEWIDGTPLEPGPIPWTQAFAELAGISHALGTLHRTGFHHGDVSPSNVLKSRTGAAVLIDFSQLGQHGRGALGFSAPEVIRGGGGSASDFFSLGCLLCLRVFGRVLWKDPAEIRKIGSERIVEQQLNQHIEQANIKLPEEARSLLLRLLSPHVHRRALDGIALSEKMRRCTGIRGEAESTEISWWLPSHFRYSGPSMQRVAERIVGGDPTRLIAIAGPWMSGRSRMASELLHELRAIAEQNAWTVRAGDECSSAESKLQHWVEAWMEDGSRTVTIVRDSKWESLDNDAAAVHAAMLRASARIGRACFVLPVSEALGRALEAVEKTNSSEIEVIWVPRWTEMQVEERLRGVLEGGERSVWAQALVEATGGWPGMVIRSIHACASKKIRQADALQISNCLEPSGIAHGMDEALARSILRAGWGDSIVLPSEWARSDHPDNASAAKSRPSAYAQRMAKSAYQGQVREWAQTYLDECQKGGLKPSLELLSDADDLAGFEAALVGADQSQELSISRTNLEWLSEHAEELREPVVVARGLEEWIRGGEPLRAKALYEDAGEETKNSTRCILAYSRALQQTGAAQRSFELLQKALEKKRDPIARAKLRAQLWRARIDLGDSSSVVEECEQELRAGTDRSIAETYLWGALAGLQIGKAASEKWIHQAIAMCEGDKEQAWIAARAYQLLGNFEQARGQLLKALAAYERAEAAFIAAGEELNRIRVQAGQADLLLSSGQIVRALEVGRKAVRALTSRFQVQALPKVFYAHLRTLSMVAGYHEAEALLRSIDEMGRVVGLWSNEKGWPAVLVCAGLQLEELSGVEASSCSFAERYAECAKKLASEGEVRGALEMWLSRSRQGRRDRNDALCFDSLEKSTQLTDETADSSLLLRVRFEQIAVLLEFSSELQEREQDRFGQELQQVAKSLETLPEAGQLADMGDVELAITYDRRLLQLMYWSANRRQHRDDESAEARRIAWLKRIERRHRGHIEAFMKKTPQIDREEISKQLFPSDERGWLQSLGDVKVDDTSVKSVSVSTGAKDNGVVADSLAVASVGLDVPSAESSEHSFPKLFSLFRRLAREDDLERLLAQLVDAMMELTHAERGVVELCFGEAKLEVAREFSEQGQAVRISRSIIERVRQTGEPVLSVDASEDERFDSSKSVSHLNLRSVLAVPILYRGQILGAAYVDHRLRRGAFDERDLAEVEDFVSLAALVVAHAGSLSELRQQKAELERLHHELNQRLEARDKEVQGLRESLRPLHRSLGAGQDTPGLEAKGYRGIIGTASLMQDVFRMIDRVSGAQVPVVIYGESGTGKEMVARAIHEAGPRAQRPFVAENCGAIPETLLESVLFGHAKGAFTGAHSANVGLFEAAEGGTIFLDEVGEMSPAMQTKLLRVLQENELRRVGENRTRKIDVRILAASNRDLDAMVENGEFRKDLFYRLQVVKIALPPLRDRREDIDILVQHFVAAHGGRLEISAAALRKLKRYPWPGNVRELENEVQRWIALVDGRVETNDLSSAILGLEKDLPDPDDLDLKSQVARLEKELIARALQRTGGNQTQAADLLGMSRFGLQKKLRRLYSDSNAASEKDSLGESVE